ncbi:MAG: 4Fe-4S dicluster domain-containing protein [Bryobacterales bacterium]|nr:4Fe-4S dicluster domain-containing protein [Bryobacterales bacterium]
MSSREEGLSGLVDLPSIGQLISLLERQGWRVIGPTVRDGAIVYERVESIDDLPRGWTEEQEAGRYRLKRRGDDALFGYNLGPQSWKKYLHPPEVRLLEARRENGLLKILKQSDPPPRYAFLGVRACELAAIAVQDRVLVGDRFADPIYEARRKNLFLIAVNCAQAAPTCFCTSMGTGPRARQGYDLAITEILEGERHEFLLEAGSEQGASVLGQLRARQAGPADSEIAEKMAEHAASQIHRRIETEGLHDLLYANWEHPRWDDAAGRCLSCGNCTMVCPTCFCTNVEDVSDVRGEHAERWRRWDSCYTLSFSYIHGGSVRRSVRSRYRQWLTHKLASWIDQFGTSGCVGCGRCITWCPVGIDLTAEVRAIRDTPTRAPKRRENRNGES